MRNIVICSYLLIGLSSIAQDDNIRPVDSIEVIRLNIRIEGDNAFIRVLHLPEALEFDFMTFREVNGKCSGGLALDPAIIGQQHSLISLKNQCSARDTFIFSIQNRFESAVKYPSIAFVPWQGLSELRFGEDCYRMSCIPQNDPWMPYVEEPFLISKKNYYLNPENGKIKSGKRIIFFGNYSACELEQWKQIEEFERYSDKRNKIYTGRELITMKRLKLKEWDVNAF